MKNLSIKTDSFDYDLMSRINFIFSKYSNEERLEIYESHIQYFNDKTRQNATERVWSILKSDNQDLNELNRALREHPDVAHHSIVLASEMEKMNEVHE